MTRSRPRTACMVVAIVYGRGIGGVYLDAKRHAVIRFHLTRSGQHEFRNSIHQIVLGIEPLCIEPGSPWKNGWFAMDNQLSRN